MRHRKKINQLSRTRPHRKAMLANMASSLILNKRIHTTVAKAKALREFVEPLMTKAKNDSTHSRRVVFSNLQNKEAVNELFREVSPKIFNRQGGYTRIIKIGARLGDNAEMCMMELVDYNENLLSDVKETKTKSTRRRRRGGKKKQTATTEKESTEKQVLDKDTGEDSTKVTEDTKAEKEKEPKLEEKTDAKAEVKSEEKKEEKKPEAKKEEKSDDNKESPKAENSGDNKEDKKDS